MKRDRVESSIAANLVFNPRLPKRPHFSADFSGAFLTAAAASSFQIRAGVFLSFAGGALTVAIAITAATASSAMERPVSSEALSMKRRSRRHSGRLTRQTRRKATSRPQNPRGMGETV